MNNLITFFTKAIGYISQFIDQLFILLLEIIWKNISYKNEKPLRRNKKVEEPGTQREKNGQMDSAIKNEEEQEEDRERKG